jgi:hypothetical protein
MLPAGQVAATGFKQQARGCYLRRIMRRLDSSETPRRTHSLAERVFSV